MHEINNPLATIAACAAAVDARLSSHADASVKEFLDIIDNEVQRCSKIVDGLLEFSRRSSTRRKNSVRINDVVERTLFLLKHHKRFKRLTVTTELHPGDLTVQANDEQLIQVLMALLLNAVDAMVNGGTLTLTTRPAAADAEALIEVRDTGLGIPAAEVAKIFEPFYTTKPPGQGTGLGLSIAYGIIQDHRGRIDVESAFGLGSRFTVVLPTDAGGSS